VDDDMTTDGDLDAGEFSSWLGQLRNALAGHGDSDVPCSGCTACCTSSQFVHIEPDEADTLAHIPPEVLFPAPGHPEGHRLLGYDERGHCPMLGDSGCSIYEHRPRTCRVYDCRIFPATGVEVEEPSKDAVARRARRWRFTFASPDAAIRRDAVRTAALYLEAHADELPGDGRPLAETPRAVMAVELLDLFTATDPATGTPTVVEPEPGDLAAAIERGRGDGPVDDVSARTGSTERA
jgi:Fe-S-cluster containining protein